MHYKENYWEKFFFLTKINRYYFFLLLNKIWSRKVEHSKRKLVKEYVIFLFDY